MLRTLVALGSCMGCPLWRFYLLQRNPEFDTKRRKLLICLKRLPEFATTAM